MWRPVSFFTHIHIDCPFSRTLTGWVSPVFSILTTFWRWEGEEILMWNMYSPNTGNHKQNRQWTNRETGWIWASHLPHSNPAGPPWELCGPSEGFLRGSIISLLGKAALLVQDSPRHCRTFSNPDLPEMLVVPLVIVTTRTFLTPIFRLPFGR